MRQVDTTDQDRASVEQIRREALLDMALVCRENGIPLHPTFARALRELEPTDLVEGVGEPLPVPGRAEVLRANSPRGLARRVLSRATEALGRKQVEG